MSEASIEELTTPEGAQAEAEAAGGDLGQPREGPTPTLAPAPAAAGTAPAMIAAEPAAPAAVQQQRPGGGWLGEEEAGEEGEGEGPSSPLLQGARDTVVGAYEQALEGGEEEEVQEVRNRSSNKGGTISSWGSH